MRAAYPQRRTSRPAEGLRTAQGPGARDRSSGALGRADRGQFFLAGTAVGSAGLAVRARLTRAVAALAGALRAGLLFLAGATFFAAFGASTASSAVALVASAASSTCFSA